MPASLRRLARVLAVLLLLPLFQAVAPEAVTPEAAAQDAPAEPAEPTPASDPASEPASDPAAEPASGSPEAAALLEILRDDAARARLIEELERAAGSAAPAGAAAEPGAEPGADPVGDPAASPEAQPEDPSLGRRIADLTSGLAVSLADWGQEVWSGLNATQRRLAGFARADTDKLLEALEAVAIVFAITVAAFWFLQIVARPLRTRIGRMAEDEGLLRRAGVMLMYLVVGLFTVFLAWAAGHLIALFLLEPRGELLIYQALYLNAFLAAGFANVVLRTILAPNAPPLRMLPMSDRSAVYWFWWTGGLAVFLIYGLMLFVPIVNEAVSIFTGRATAVLIYMLVLVVAIVLVIRHRKDPHRYYSSRAASEGGDVTLSSIAFVARFWHLAVIGYLLVIAVFALTEAGDVSPVLIATGKIALAAIIGVFAANLIGRASQSGITLPASVTDRLPLIEKRINTFVPGFLRIVRFLIFLAVLAFALNATGLVDMEAWLRGAFGVDVASTIVSVALILIAAFAAWLALSSWVDWRLTPRPGRIVTSREQTLLTLLRNAASIAIAIIALMFALSEIGIDIAPLIASAGVLGLAIGFGAQKLVQDIITGIFIQFENAMNVGDVVTVGGTSGVVEKLTIRSVSLRDVEGVFHIIPFSSVDSVSNYMRGFAYHVADMGIAYREDIDEAKQVMLEAFEELRADPERAQNIIGDMEWFGVQSLGDNAVVLRARIKTRPGSQWGIGRSYNEIVKKRFDAAAIEIPFPQTTVWFGEAKQGAAPAAHFRIDNAKEVQPVIEAPKPTPEDPAPAKRPTQDEPPDPD